MTTIEEALRELLRSWLNVYETPLSAPLEADMMTALANSTREALSLPAATLQEVEEAIDAYAGSCVGLRNEPPNIAKEKLLAAVSRYAGEGWRPIEAGLPTIAGDYQVGCDDWVVTGFFSSSTKEFSDNNGDTIDDITHWRYIDFPNGPLPSPPSKDSREVFVPGSDSARDVIYGRREIPSKDQP